MKLILAKKPSVPKNIANALKIKIDKIAILKVMDILLHGYLLQLKGTKDYDAKMVSWKMDNFPFTSSGFSV
ncbi:hypothetical protein [Niallia sp. NCCP-28]|uniref:hypothetical protein n=1 Tax=Niallia sp. NCCP-28 TaxID=2934712 RepID=UPI00208B14E3|nr:hypothetical protein [Niallia sp. NCCP-28]GKU80932.1 hypothetical protein NCCP28_03280 [Niallia sp. NCCP-28]